MRVLRRFSGALVATLANLVRKLKRAPPHDPLAETLSHEARDHNGRPLLPADIRASLERHRRELEEDRRERLN